MDHRLTIELGNTQDLTWAQQTVQEHHYLHSPVDPRARPMVYVIKFNTAATVYRVGLVMLGIPHAAKCRGWWGYDGLPTQWQVVDLNRIWLHDTIQAGHCWCEPDYVPGFFDRRGVWRPAVATWAISEVLQRVQEDRVKLWPPVYPDQPYHIRLAISYHDPKFHRGVIYQQSKAKPMYTDKAGQPTPGPSGKYGWCWQLGAPSWTWQDLTGIQSRTMRLF